MTTLLDSFVNCSPGSKPCLSWQRGRGWCTRGRWWWGGQRLPSGRLKDATSSRTPRPKTWTATWRLLRLPSRLREFNICMWWGKMLLDFPLDCTIGACDDSTKKPPSCAISFGISSRWESSFLIVEFLTNQAFNRYSFNQQDLFSFSFHCLYLLSLIFVHLNSLIL